jgi:hypothetical protein
LLHQEKLLDCINYDPCFPVLVGKEEQYHQWCNNDPA